MILMKKFLYILIIACLPVFSSCDDYLNIVPKGEKIPTTLADFESLLRNEYTIGQTPLPGPTTCGMSRPTVSC